MPGTRVTFLSPFDGLVKNRDRAEALWDFFYRLEMYVPKAKREYGYYVLPILRGDRLIGRIEPAFDRKTGVLHVHGVFAEPGAPAAPGRGIAARRGASRSGSERRTSSTRARCRPSGGRPFGDGARPRPDRGLRPRGRRERGRAAPRARVGRGRPAPGPRDRERDRSARRHLPRAGRRRRRSRGGRERVRKLGDRRRPSAPARLVHANRRPRLRGRPARPDDRRRRTRSPGRNRAALANGGPRALRGGAVAALLHRVGTRTPYPGEALAQSATIDELRLQGDPRRIAQWVGDADVPITVREGQPELQSFVLDKAVLDPGLWA